MASEISSDTGVSLTGNLMDKMMDYQLGVYEGEGYFATGDGQGFAYAGRVGLNLGGLTVSLFDWMETKRSGNNDYNPSRFIGMVTYGTPTFRVAGQYLAADDHKSGNNVLANTLVNGIFNKGTGFSVWGYSRIPGIEPLRVMARFDSMKPEADFDTGTNTMIRAAISYDLSKTVIIALDETIKTTKVDNSGGSMTDNLLGIKAQVAF